MFELEVDLDSVTAGDFSCEIGIADNDPQCLLYFEIFCLREGRGNSQSTDENDCPLGKNTERMNAYENRPNTRIITSDSPWPVRSILIWLMTNSTHSRKGVWILMSFIINWHNINSGDISILH